MSYFDDDYDEHYEEYCRKYEEKTLCVDGGIPVFEDNKVYFLLDIKYIRFYSRMGKKYLTNIIEACENMPRCYEEYLALGKKICANIDFGEYIYFKYGFWNKHVNERSFKSIKPSREKLSCSTSLSKEEEEGTKGEDSSDTSKCSRFMRFFGFYSNKDSKHCEMSTTKYEEVSFFLGGE